MTEKKKTNTIKPRKPRTSKKQGDENYEVGYKKPPVDTRFGGKKANKRNNLGRPTSFAELRRLAQMVGSEEIGADEKGKIVTRVEAMLKLMSSSRNPSDRKLFLEYTYGKPKEELDITSGGEAIDTTIKVIEIVKTYENQEDTNGKKQK